MQILESSVLGLRSARLVFSNRESGHSVTLFPMVHVGEADFYAATYRDAFDHDVALVEGVDSPVVRHLTRSYRWINLAKLDLVLQSRAASPGTAGTRIVRADLSAEEFHAEWRKVQLWLRLAALLAAPAIGIHRRLFASRESLAEKMSLEDRRSGDEILSWNPRYSALEHSVLSARDRRLIEHLGAELSDADGAKRISIVFGAAHIRAVIAELARRGFACSATEWRTVFAL